MAITVCCNLTKNLLKGNNCGYSLPEVKDIYIANYTDVTNAPLDYNSESGVTISGFSGASGSVYHIEPAKNSVTFTDELVVNDNGSKYRTHTLTFTIDGKYDKDMVCPVDALALGRFFVVVKTADGVYLALGRSTGLEASEQSVAGGGDNNGITVTLSANVAESAVPLSDTAVSEMLALVHA